MSRTFAVVKREFNESVRTKTFIVGTVLGPVLMIGLFAVQFLLMSRGGGGSHSLVILDATDADVGGAIAAALDAPRQTGARPIGQRAEYTVGVERVDAAGIDAARERLNTRVVARDVDGFLILPPDVVQTGAARYEGENATNSAVTGDLRTNVQRVVHLQRLAAAGIDPANVESALRPVSLETVKTGGRGASGSAQAAMLVAMAMGFAIYLVVLLYGAAVMNGVIEEKRDRVVELIVSSIRARDLMLGKVVGIGGAGMLQMAIWVAAAALLLMHGAAVLGALGVNPDTVAALGDAQLLPRVPLTVGIVFLFYFGGGFFLYSTLYAIIGAIATTSQEAQQLVFPAILPLVLGFFMLFPSLENPDGGVAMFGSMLPFTSPLIMPARHAIIGVSPFELAASLALLVFTGLAIIWVGAKIYRIGIFATGQRATPSEIWRWIRTA